MEGLGTAIEVAKVATEVVKKINDVKKTIDTVTTEKDGNFGGTIIKGEIVNTLRKNINSFLEKKEEVSKESNEQSIQQLEVNIDKEDDNLTKKVETNECNVNNNLNSHDMVNSFLDSKENKENNLELSLTPECSDEESIIDNNKLNGNKDNAKVNNDNIEGKSGSFDKLGLSDNERLKVKEDTGWSDEIINAIGSYREYEVYKDANLKEVDIGDRKCLIRSDINMDQKDEFGRTNKERMKNGQMPITQCGEDVELHHIGQKMDSPLAELTTNEHRRGGNDTILHDKQKESEIDRYQFKKEREAHWKERGNQDGINTRRELYR